MQDELPEEDDVVPRGQAVVRRPGDDVTIVTFGAMTHTALDAANQLAERDVAIEVIDLRTLSPLDYETILQSVAKTNKVIVLHEAQRTGGIGAEIAAAIAERGFEHLDAPPVRLASLDTPVPYSPALEAAFRPSVEQIVAAVEHLVEY